MIVIDSGSTHRTVELAKAQGAKVTFRAWDDDFAAQRNFALEQTEADWVLYLDADERFNDELIAAIHQILENGDKGVQYAITRKSVAFDVTFNHGVLGRIMCGACFPARPSDGSIKCMNILNVTCQKKDYLVISNTIHTAIGKNGKKSSAYTRLFGRKMPINGANGRLWEVFSSTASEDFSRCSSSAKAFLMELSVPIYVVPISFIPC